MSALGRPAPEVAGLLNASPKSPLSPCPYVIGDRCDFGTDSTDDNIGIGTLGRHRATFRPAPEVAFLLKCTGQSLCPGVTERRGLWGCRLYGRLNARTISGLGRWDATERLSVPLPRLTDC